MQKIGECYYLGERHCPVCAARLEHDRLKSLRRQQRVECRACHAVLRKQRLPATNALRLMTALAAGGAFFILLGTHEAPFFVGLISVFISFIVMPLLAYLSRIVPVSSPG